MGRRPNRTQLSDADTKRILREVWPARTKLWNGPEEENSWLRAQPANTGAVGPRLVTPGAQLFHIQPDGMWVRLLGGNGGSFGDVIAIEACGTMQNFNDKRARYMSSTASLLLRCPTRWLEGGAEANPNWKVAGFAQCPVGEASFPVRHIRVLYALPGDIYRTWQGQGVLAGHEFLCLHYSLGTYNGQLMQIFLKQMAPSSHFYIQDVQG